MRLSWPRLRRGIGPTCAVLLLLALGLTAPALAAQDQWFAGVYLDHDSFVASVPAWDDWQAIRASVVRDLGRGAIGLEIERAERFDQSDVAGALDLYVPLWEGSYANLRARYAPDPEILPTADWRLEVFQSLPSGWEASANIRHSTVPGPEVTVLGVGLGKYVSAWYLRGTATTATVGLSRSSGAALFARLFFADDPRQFIELGGGLGGESVVVGPGPILDVRDTAFFQLSFQRTVRGPFGVHATLGMHDFEGVPRRSHITAGVTARF